MLDLTAYDDLLEEARAVDQSAVIALNMPVNVLVHEALRLYEWAVKDRDALAAAGMDWNVAESLTVRSQALRHAQSIWISERFHNEEAQKAWAERSPSAYDLRNSMMHTFRFAFRKRPDLMRMLGAMAARKGHVAMLQDLKDLAVAGRRNVLLLEAVGFDPTLLDRCETLAEQLGAIYAEARNDRASYRKAKTIRDALATLLKQSVDEVREYGQFVFRLDKKRRKGYTSDYHRKIKRPAALSDETAGEKQEETVAE